MGIFPSKLAKINIRKACGRDGISSREIKIVSKDIDYLIASTEAKWTMRRAHIQVCRRIIKSRCCTGKGGDSADCGNYRPLTMLSIPNNIAESAICDTIDVHHNEILHQNQWGYRKSLLLLFVPYWILETLHGWRRSFWCNFYRFPQSFWLRPSRNSVLQNTVFWNKR